MKDETAPPNPIYIYTLSCPSTGNVRYVGVTKMPKERLRKHIQEAKRTVRHNHRIHWINSLLADGLKPIMTIIDETDNDNWEKCEIEWITHYRAMGCNLVNSTDGGGGILNPSEETRRKIGASNKGRIHNEESRKKMSESQKRRPPASEETRRKLSIATKNMTDETRRKISDSKKGKKKSAETCKRISESKRNISDETRQKIGQSQKRSIYQYDKFGHFIRQWDGIIDASRALSIQKSDIAKCCACTGRYKSAGGFIWRYADDPLLDNPPDQLSLDFE